MTTYTLTQDDADKVNAVNSLSVDKDGNYSTPVHEEGQEFPCVELPTGTTLVFVDSDVPLRVVTADVESDEVPQDETPDDVPPSA